MLLKKLFPFSLLSYLFLLPWATIWIWRKNFVDGVLWEYGTLGLYATEIILWVAIATFTFSFWNDVRSREKKPFRLTRDRIWLLSCLVFILYALASALWTEDTLVAWQHGLFITEATFLLIMIRFGQIEVEETTRWFFLGAIIPSALGLWQFFAQKTFSSSIFGLALHPAWQAGTSVLEGDHIGRWLRAYGSFPHPNIFGGYLALALIVYELCLIKKNRQKINLAEIIASLVITAAFFFSFSRAAWLALILWSGVTMIFSQYRNNPLIRRLLFYRIMLAAALLFIFWPLATARVAGTSIQQTRSVTERISGWEESVALSQKNFWFGVGIGNYPQAIRSASPSEPIWNIQPVHVVPLLILAELGIVGILLLLLKIITYFRFVRLDKAASREILLVSCPFFVLLVADHYLFSSYIGLMLAVTFEALLLRQMGQK